MHKLVVDITYLAHWQGRLTGIPRVISELATNYSKSSGPVKFVVWSNQASLFFEVDVNATLSDRGKKLHYIESGNSSSLIIATPALIGKVAARLKDRYKLPVPSRLVDGLRRFDARRYKRIHFTAGDKLLIPMGEWHDLEYIDSLKFLHKQGVGIVQVSYDVLPLVQPQYSGHSTKSMEHYNSEIMPISSLVLAISENTKRDLTKWLKSRKLSVPRIEVFRLGDDFDLASPTKPGGTAFKNTGLKGGDYILCVGTVEARKNHTLLYYVYKLAMSKRIDLPKLLVVGRRGWKTDNIYEIVTTDPDTKNQIIFLEDVSDESLAWLYLHALFSIYPSFYEGWGLPIAESVLYGTPCLASNTSSTPEIAGNLVNYFNPASTDDCLRAIMQLMKPQELKKAKVAIKKYKPTTWEDTYKQVNNYIQELDKDAS